MGVVNEAVEDGVGIGRIADHLVPLLDRKLAGDDGRAAAVALFEDFEEIVPRVGIERFETPVVEDEQIDARERLRGAWRTSVAAGQRQLGEQFRDALIKRGAVVAAGLVAERAGKPGLADAGRAADREIVVGVDPIARDEFLEQRPVETARASGSRRPRQRLDGEASRSEAGRKAAYRGDSSSRGREAGQGLREAEAPRRRPWLAVR